jgi:hypothetical protein
MDSRILGIIGGVLLVIGVFCPLVGIDILGQSLNVSYIGSAAGTRWEGLVLILLGVAGIILAVLRKFRMLIIPGVLALLILVISYFGIRSDISEMTSMAGSRSAEVENAFSMKWGWIPLILGALALIAGGAMGRNLPAPGPNYGAPPPPPPPYPGR